MSPSAEHLSHDPGGAPRLRDLAFHYQPIFAEDLRRPVGYEALVRWPRPDGTVRGPADFLGSFLSGQELEPFTRHGLTAVGTLLASRPAVPRLHVNLSPQQLMLPVVPQLLTRLRPAVRDRLVVELTQQRVPDLDGFAASVGELRDAGVRVLLDDVIPSELPTRLPPHLPVIGIKVASSVIPELLVAPWGAAGRSIRRLVKGGLFVAAEGVEDPASLPALRELGIGSFQGFGLARPQRSLDQALATYPPDPTRAADRWL